MPLQYLLTNEANARFRAAGRWDLVGTPGGQVLGQLDRIRSVKQILDEFRGQAADAVTAVEQGLEG
jgi:hypothetical protein